MNDSVWAQPSMLNFYDTIITFHDFTFVANASGFLCSVLERPDILKIATCEFH